MPFQEKSLFLAHLSQFLNVNLYNKSSLDILFNFMYRFWHYKPPLSTIKPMTAVSRRSPRINALVSFPIKFGERVYELRMERKLTQEELGSRVGLDPAFISQIENGRKNLTLLSVSKLAKALGVPALELFRF